LILSIAFASVQVVDEAPPLLKPKQVAERLCISIVTLKRHVKKGTIGHYRVGRQLRFSQEQVDAFAKARKAVA
jgi:excisionase family DNA binding protein